MSLLADFGAGLLGKGLDIWSGRQAAEDQRSWDENVYKHRYQWQMQDMRKAGLNPMLSFMQSPGSGPSTQAADTGDSFMSGVSSAASARRVTKEMELMDAQIRKTNAEADLTGKTMPPADPWRILYELFGKSGVSSIGSTARSVVDYVGDTVKTFPLKPQEKPYRQAVQALTERQREQLRKKGSYTRPARKR